MNYPSNPTGMAYSKKELQALAEVLKKIIPFLDSLQDQLQEVDPTLDNTINYIHQVVDDFVSQLINFNLVS